ncbi:MAG: MarR family transcriptional regulator [Flaviflexus sp.]|nr:MarR family transcriptional regulator [Flaviflexus sp.]
MSVSTREISSSLRIAVLHLSRTLRGNGTPLGESRHSVLAALRRHGAMTVGDLARHERVTMPSMSKLVSTLSEEGYVACERMAEDGRKVGVSLTEKGENILVTAHVEGLAWLEERLGALSREELATLGRAAAIMRGMCEE